MNIPRWAEFLIEFSYNGAMTLSGYMLGAKALAIPDTPAWILAGLAGLIGVGNHVRALRKSPTAP
jgi:hypothetical protein